MTRMGRKTKNLMLPIRVIWRNPRLIFSLVQVDLEFALLIPDSPVASDELIVSADVLQLPIDDVMYRLAPRVLQIRLEAQIPAGHRVGNATARRCERELLQ